MKEDLIQKLHDLRVSNTLPMHMPGHKRNPTSAPYGIPYSSDITEIDGFDNLHSPEGVIRGIELKAASLWAADDAFISVNGATALIQSAILSSTVRGDKILIASNCHISVWHALEIGGLKPVIAEPGTKEEYPFVLQIDPETIRTALRKDPDIRAVVITSPTYEGIMSDTAAIHKITSDAGVILIVDEAHGAHLGVKDQTLFPASASGDIVIKSVHKTLNAPTQTAVMLIRGDRADKRLIRHYLSINESTSPSYLLMAGLEHALNTADTDSLYKNARAGRDSLGKLEHLKLFACDGYDISKFVILTEGYISGFDLADLLRKEFLIEIEAAFPTYIIAMTGTGDTAASIKRFTDAILAIDSSLSERIYAAGTSELKPVPRRSKLPVEKAVKSPSVSVTFDEAAGAVSAEYLFAYPPGIPLLIPGQEITEELIGIIEDMTAAGSSLKTEPYRTWDGTLLKVDTDARHKV